MAQTFRNKIRQFENWQHAKVQVRLATRLELVNVFRKTLNQWGLNSFYEFWLLGVQDPNPVRQHAKVQVRLTARLELLFHFGTLGLMGVEIAAKLANILEVSLDYLVGNSDVEMASKTMSRIVELQSLPDAIQEKLNFFIDMSIRDHKAKQAYS